MLIGSIFAMSNPEVSIPMPKEKVRQLVAIMFTDMVGYTALMQEDEQKAVINRERHRKVLEKTIAAYGGKIVQYYGDGTLSIFPSAIEAVTCAVEIQNALQKNPKVPLRIGLHTGDIVEDEDGIYGDAVNVTSRIEATSVPGAVVVSGKLYDEIKNHPDLKAKKIGLFELKNVKEPLEIYAVCSKGLVIPSAEEINGKLIRNISSIAVLPFVNMSSDPENEYFSDGITEEILNALTRVEGLQVTSRTSSFALKGKNEDVRKIGNKLNVSTVLEGSVRRSGDKVRITAQLINVSDGYHIFSETYDRLLEDIFDVQDEIALNIANKLRENMAVNSERQRLVEPVTRNLEVYNLYLKGHYYANKCTPEDTKKAIVFFKEAIEKEPDFALPYTGLSYSYSFLGASGQMPPAEVYPKAREAALKALELNDSLYQSHLALGIIKFFNDWDWDGARESFQRALELSPGSAETHHYFGLFHSVLGNLHEAITELKIAVQLDPLSPLINDTLSDTYFLAERYELALEQCRRTLDLDPNFRTGVESLGSIYLMMGKTDKAIEAFEKLYHMTDHELKGVTGLGVAYGRAGKTKKAHECLEKLEKRREKDKKIHLEFDFALIYTALDNRDKAFEYLQKAADLKLGGILMVRSSPFFKELRTDKRFAKLLHKIGLEA